MKTLKIYLAALSLCFCFSASGGQQKSLEEEELQLRMKADRWLSPYRNEKTVEFEEWAILVETDPTAAREHSFFQHMQSFYKQHEEQYHRVRLESLENHPAAPKELPGYEVMDRRYLEDFFEEDKLSLQEAFDLLGELSNMRVYGVEATSFAVGLVNFPILQFMANEKEIDERELYAKHILGWLNFADKIDSTLWKITVVNRVYALEYLWDYTSNQLQFQKALIYTGDKQASGWLHGKQPQARTPKEELFNKLGVFSWALYDHTYPDFDVDEIDDRKEVFLGENRNAYTAVRRQVLGIFPPIDAERWDEYTQVDTELTNDIRQGLSMYGTHEGQKLPVWVSFNELYYYPQVLSIAESMMNRYSSSPTDNHLYMVGWILGREVYTRDLGENLWEIQFFHRNFALNYRWNIVTDEISQLEIRRRS